MEINFIKIDSALSELVIIYVERLFDLMILHIGRPQRAATRDGMVVERCSTIEGLIQAMKITFLVDGFLKFWR